MYNVHNVHSDFIFESETQTIVHNLMAAKYMSIYGVSPDGTLLKHPTGVIDSVPLFAEFTVFYH